MSLATVRRLVESMLGQVLGVHQHTRLESCLLRLVATPDGRTELAAIADASPFAAWDATAHVFFYTYHYVFGDSGPLVRAISSDARERPSLWPMPPTGVRCVHLGCADGRLCVRVEVAPTTRHQVSFATEQTHAVLHPGRHHDLLYERRSTATAPHYALVAARAVD